MRPLRAPNFGGIWRLSIPDRMTGWNEPSRSRRALVDSESRPKPWPAPNAHTRKQWDDVLNQALLTSAPQSPMLDQTIGPTEPTQLHQCLRQKGVRSDTRHQP